MNIQLKRAYEAAERSDGPRVLVDRIWPRGLAKEDADIAHWLKGLAPSTELRKWFGHDPDKWPEFRERYLEELTSGDAGEDLEALKKLLEQNDSITLVFAAKDTEHNNAVALRDFILKDSL
ncbi:MULTISPECIES: DUF488 domain-containing protein [Marinobacter]|uniref:DUF488 domain-containing protein n=1 Tax=Marinobacter TaxID=2742 RepID=UPI0007D96F9E|nr:MULTISPECIES: DUF488 family protein [unclassified Marinobacter]MBL3825979.1 DUF488 family protein [Marinobacter sp. MC3]MBL3894446.1 DUF488 family protein [Marinobacter sp. MW3]OAN89894.1 hypothetical protein A8B84_11245 [Marinobacter sp. EhC06]OAN94135.1 hypothetical protein A8B80_16405 [Marinobacter sp. EhN04]